MPSYLLILMPRFDVTNISKLFLIRLGIYLYFTTLRARCSVSGWVGYSPSVPANVIPLCCNMQIEVRFVTSFEAGSVGRLIMKWCQQFWWNIASRWNQQKRWQKREMSLLHSAKSKYLIYIQVKPRTEAEYQGSEHNTKNIERSGKNNQEQSLRTVELHYAFH